MNGDPHPNLTRSLSGAIRHRDYLPRAVVEQIMRETLQAAEAGGRLVRVGMDLFNNPPRMRTDDGYLVTMEPGEPDSFGIYTPILHIHHDDQLVANIVVTPSEEGETPREPDEQ